MIWIILLSLAVDLVVEVVVLEVVVQEDIEIPTIVKLLVVEEAQKLL
jgi:hypothetical protein